MNEELTPDIVKTIREVQNVLLRIHNREKFFFNITQYQNQGLIYGKNRYANDSSGNREWIGTDWYLTEKGKRVLNTAI